MMRRLLNFASFLCLATCLVVVAMWVRSYRHADRIHGGFSERSSFLLASKQGRVTAIAFRLNSAVDWWQWSVHTFAIDDEMSFPLASVRQYEWALGFGIVKDPAYMVTRSTFETPEGATILISGAAIAILRGSGVVVPYWFFVLLFGMTGAFLRLERPIRYTTRSLLIAITFMAILLGLVAGLDQAPDPWTLDIPAPLDEL